MTYYQGGINFGGPAVRTCRNCGAYLKESDIFCWQCGAKTEAPSKNICPNCHAENKISDAFCIYCGASLTGNAPAPSFVSAPEPAPTPIPVGPPEAKNVCPNCHAENKISDAFCIYCGASLMGKVPAPSFVSAPEPAPTPIPARPPEAKNVCPNCHAENKISDAFCIYCGASLTGKAPAPSFASAPEPAPTHIPAAPPEAKNVCPNCHAENKISDAFCICCGASLTGKAPAPSFVSAPEPAPAGSQMRQITISRASQFVCAANTYKVIVNGSPLGNIPVGRTIVATVSTDVATVEIICTTIMINKKLRMKLHLGANPAVSFSVQWPGDIFASVQDAQILEKSN